MNTASPRHLRHRGTRNIDLCHDCALLLPTPLATRRRDDIELGWSSPRSRHSAVSAPVCDNRTESRLPPAHHTRRATPEAYKRKVVIPSRLPRSSTRAPPLDPGETCAVV